MELAEGQTLCQFLSSEAQKLISFGDIQIDDPIALAVEVKARQRAYETVKEMLSPLLDTTQFDIMNTKDDSIATEMLQDKRSSQPNQDYGN